MKSYFFTVSVIMVMLLLQISSTAQRSTRISRQYAKYSLEGLIPGSREVNTEKKSGFLFRNDINMRAVRYFVSNYENASNVTWRQSAKGAAAYYMIDGIRTSVYFDKNGEYQCQIRYYFEDQLSPEISQTIKARYSAYKIYCVSELNRHGQTECDIRLENSIKRKTIKFSNGEIKEVESYFKL